MRGEGCPKLAHSPSARTKACNSPLSAAYAYVEAADLLRHKAAARFDAGLPCGPEANMAKLRASQMSCAAANVRIDTHGGYGFLDKYDVVRKFGRRAFTPSCPSATTCLEGRNGFGRGWLGSI